MRFNPTNRERYRGCGPGKSVLGQVSGLRPLRNPTESSSSSINTMMCLIPIIIATATASISPERDRALSSKGATTVLPISGHGSRFGWPRLLEDIDLPRSRESSRTDSATPRDRQHEQFASRRQRRQHEYPPRTSPERTRARVAPPGRRARETGSPRHLVVTVTARGGTPLLCCPDLLPLSEGTSSLSQTNKGGGQDQHTRGGTASLL